MAGLRELLEQVAAEPDRARIVIVEANTAGPGRRAALRGDGGGARRRSPRRPRGGAGRARRPPPSFEDAAVAGLAWILHQRLAVGEPVVVEELLPEMAGFLVAPYEKA